MRLEDCLRKETWEVRDALRKLDDEGLPSLGRQKQAVESDLGEIERKIQELEEEKSQIAKRTERNNKRLNTLRQFHNKLERERSELSDRDFEITSEIKSERSELKRVEKDLNHRHDEITQKVEQKGILESELRDKEIAALFSYLSTVRQRFLTYSTKSKQMEEKRRMRDAFEEERHQNGNLMELWESWRELRNLYDAQEIPSVRQGLERLIEENEQEIEKRFPGALEIENLEQDQPCEDFLVASYDERTSKTTVLLPISSDDLDVIENNPTDSSAEAFLRLAWALGKAADTSPERTMVDVGNHGWAVARFKEGARQLVGEAFDVPLAGGGVHRFIIDPLPTELESVIDSE